jgi:lactoylglutathione lyase
MIKGLYETHLFVKNLENSIDFYSNKMELELCRFKDERRTAFFWVGKTKQSTVGSREKPKEQIDIIHFTFEYEPDRIQNEAVNYLKSRNIKHCNFLNDGTEGPMIFVWTPAI